MDFKPTIYDPETALDEDEGLFYDGVSICSIVLYWEDDDVDYENGYLGCLTSFYDPSDPLEPQFGDGLWTGYKSVAECLEGEWRVGRLVRLTDRGYDCHSTRCLIDEMREDGLDLMELLTEADELLAKANEGSTFVLVYSPHGIVGEDGSSVRLFETFRAAWSVMHREATYDPDFECGYDPGAEDGVGRWHATNDTSDPDAAEWHIYEVRE